MAHGEGVVEELGRKPPNHRDAGMNHCAVHGVDLAVQFLILRPESSRPTRYVFTRPIIRQFYLPIFPLPVGMAKVFEPLLFDWIVGEGELVAVSLRRHPVVLSQGLDSPSGIPVPRCVSVRDHLAARERLAASSFKSTITSKAVLELERTV